MLTNSLRIEFLHVSEVREYSLSSRQHNQANLAKLKRALDRFGQVLPIIVDEKRVIVDGNAVYRALRELGAEQIAVVVVTGRSDAEIRALRLALNRIPLDAKWDRERLKQEFQSLIDLSFEMELTGFEVVEIDFALNPDAPQANVLEDHQAIPQRPQFPTTQVGDIWRLNEHRVACADALDPLAHSDLLQGQRPAMSFCDPPYNVPIRNFVSGLGRKTHREFVQASGEMTRVEYQAFLGKFTENLGADLIDGGVAFVCIDWRHFADLASAATLSGLELINVCVWAKTNAGMGSLYRSQHEFVCVFRSGSAPIRNNVELGRHGRHRTNLWSYRGFNSFGADRDELLASHPTVKPVAMVADAIRDVTRRKEIVLDVFLGSGSTLVAAEETGRRCFGMELDPGYVDVTVQRWQQHTGRDAVHAISGETFSDLATARVATTEGGHGDR